MDPLTYFYKSFPDFIITRSSRSVSFLTRRQGKRMRISMSVRYLLWSLAGLFSQIQVTSRWKGLTRGMCGPFDDNSGNDLMMREGVVADNPNQLGNNWKEPGYSCSDVPENQISVTPCTVSLVAIGFPWEGSLASTGNNKVSKIAGFIDVIKIRSRDDLNLGSAFKHFENKWRKILGF